MTVWNKKEKVPAHLTTYGCSDDIHFTDKRQVEWIKQREERGFDDTEMWSLKTTFARFMLPRLKEYKILDTPNNWKTQDLENLNKIIIGFEILATGQGTSIEQDTLIQEALQLFAENIQSYWT